MKIAVIEPGEGIVLRNFIDQEKAILTGKFIRKAIEKQDIETNNKNKLLMQRWMATTGETDKLPLDTLLEELIDETTNEVALALGSQFDTNLLHIAATHMNSPISSYRWHIDPRRDLRMLVNVSEDEEMVMTSKRQLDCGPSDNATKARDMPDKDDVLEHILEPGSAYFINNLVGNANRLFHATPTNRVGRTMLRYEQHVENPLVGVVDLWLRDAVQLEPIPRSA